MGEKSMKFLQALRNVFLDLSARETHQVEPTMTITATPYHPPDGSHWVSTTTSVPQEVQQKNIPVLPISSPTILKDFVEESPAEVYKYFLLRLKKAIKFDSDQAILFYIPLLNQLAVINREEYESMLNKIYEHFIKVELYEQAGLCKQLLLKHAVNEVIRKTK
jgi:hypothetical protein